MTNQEEPWAVRETRRMHAQTPEEALLEELHRAIVGIESLDRKTRTHVGQDGRPYTVTYYSLGREEGYIKGLAQAIATIRAGSGYVHGFVATDIISEMTTQVLRELRGEATS
jgi:hypothetical protein